MGADLYIESITATLRRRYERKFNAALKTRDALTDRNSKEWEKAHSNVTKYYNLLYSQGYFRDSYNITSVLNTLGMSWWADVIPLLDGGHRLAGKQLRTFRQRVVEAKQTLPTKETLEAGRVCLAKTGEKSLAGWHEYYINKRQELVAFLDQAIALKTSIRCSL